MSLGPQYYRNIYTERFFRVFEPFQPESESVVLIECVLENAPGLDFEDKERTWFENRAVKVDHDHCDCLMDKTKFHVANNCQEKRD